MRSVFSARTPAPQLTQVNAWPTTAQPLRYEPASQGTVTPLAVLYPGGVTATRRAHTRDDRCQPAGSNVSESYGLPASTSVHGGECVHMRVLLASFCAAWSRWLLTALIQSSSCQLSGPHAVRAGEYGACWRILRQPAPCSSRGGVGLGTGWVKRPGGDTSRACSNQVKSQFA